MKKIFTWAAILSLLTGVLFFSGCGKKQNPLVGTWTVQSVDGSTKSPYVGDQFTFSESGKVYDTDDFLAWAFNDDYPITSWEVVSDGKLMLAGMFGDTCKVTYSISGNSLSMTDSYGSTTVFKKS